MRSTSLDRRLKRSPIRKGRLLEHLEPRNLLAVGFVELGASDNIALDQPRVAVELAADVDPGPGVEWESIGPSLFNTFLLDTGASSVLAMATAIADMEQSNLGYDVQGQLLEGGVAGAHLLDVSVPYRFDFAGSDGQRHTLLDARIMSDATKDFSSLGPWGLAGMPAMEGRVTSLDFTGWSGGGLDLNSIYMDTEFRNDVPASNGHRYTISLDNRLSFDPLDQMIFGEPPIWGDVPFVTGIPEHDGIAQQGNFLFDTGAQISLLSKRLALDIGLDSNGDGELDQNDTNYVTQQVVGGVGGQISVPVFGFDEFHLPTDSGVDMVWTDLQWLVLDIDIPGQQSTLDGVLGSDLLTSGWFHAFFTPGQPDGYINQIHMDFRSMEVDGTGKVHFDLNPDVDNVILPGPGFIIRQSFSTTDVGEGGETDSYSIVLTGAPTHDVTITLENADGQVELENAADGSDTLVFTPQNWDKVQTVLVTAVNDLAAEGNHSTLVTHSVASDDNDYDGLAAPSVTVRIIDDDLNQLQITSDRSGANPIDSVDAFEGGDDVFYWVALSEQPSSTYWVLIEDISGQTYAEKADNPDPFPLQNILEFHSGNWNQPQRVRLNAQEDPVKEGNHQSTMLHTILDLGSGGITIGQSPLIVNITDDDLGVVTITPSTSTNVSESGATDTYEIALNLAPSGGNRVEVTIQADAQLQVSSDGQSFGSSQVLAFTGTESKTITVRAIDDDMAEDTHFGMISHEVTGAAGDPRYPNTLSIDSFVATIADNDVAGLSFTSSPPRSKTIVNKSSAADTSVNLTEAGSETMYWVALSSQPQAEVTVFLSSDDGQATAVDDNQPDNAFLTFDSTNWQTPQAVRIIAVDDSAVEGVHHSQIAHNTLSADSAYQGSVLLPIVITDDDHADFGDAPEPYPTAVSGGGAHHVADGPRLGANRDTEIDGVASAGASGDDTDNALDDEDGVQFGVIEFDSTMAAVNILLEGASSGKVDAWIDFDRDGSWTASEKILDSVVVSSAMQTLNYDLPQDLAGGDTYARVRISSDGNLGPTGPAADGEVEDYLVHILSPPVIESVVVNHGDAQRSSVTELTVNFDRLVEIDQQGGDPFRIINVDSGQSVTAVPVITSNGDNTKTVVELTFAAGPSVNGMGGLIDGNYQLIIDASLVNYHGVAMDGDGNATAGGNYVFGDDAADAFFRKYGDDNGNGLVDLLDFAEFRGTFGKSAGQTGYVSGLDSDGDQSIGLLDFAAFRRSFG